MREFWMSVHRWAGLLAAAFLIALGLSGGILSWGYEIDAWLNPDLFATSTEPGPFLSPQERRARVEAQDDRAQITSLPLAFEKGRPAIFDVRPKGAQLGGRFSGLGYGEVYVDPTTGAIMGRRDRQEMGLSGRGFLPLVYYIHYTFAMSDDYWWYARRLAVIAGVFWILNCLTGLYISLPRTPRRRPDGSRAGPSFWRLWKPAWKVAFDKGAYRANFDLHRAFSLWLWAFLLVQAMSATTTIHFVQRNFVVPVMGLFGSQQTPGPFVGVYADLNFKAPVESWRYTRRPTQKPVKEGASVTYGQAIEIASTEARARGWSDILGRVIYTERVGEDYAGNASVYRVRFFQEPGDDNRFTTNISSNRIKELYVDGVTGAIVGDRVPWQGSAVDVVMQQIFPFHSSLVYGWYGRIAATVLGFGTAMLSITGLVIWWKKRRSRRKYQAAKVRASKKLEEAPAE